MKLSTVSLSLFACAATVVGAVAQTTTARSAHPAGTAHRTAASAATPACAKLPDMSPKIPALPAGLPCPKPLYTLTRKPDVVLDYASPLVTPELRATLDEKPTTISLVYVDTKVGTGPLAQPHMFYTVHYTGYLPDGTKFDSSVDRNEPFTFPYGGHRVIAGWDTGFEGMRLGGKRRLFVPYQLGYGDAGHPPVIPARSELIFDVELISQSATQPAPKAPPAPPASSSPSTPPAGAQPRPSQPEGSAPTGSAPAAKPSTTTPPPGNPQK